MNGIPMKPWEILGANSIDSYNTNPNSINSNIIVTDRLHSSPIPFPGSGGGSIIMSTNNNMNTTGIGGASPSTSSAAPPLPPRPGQTRPLYSATNSSMYSPYNRFGASSYMSPYTSSYGSYGGGGYSPYGGSMYGSRLGGGMYGSGYGMPGMPGMVGGMNGPDGQPNFLQLAEESSASAFQSIESFVSAFGSISAMLESTFHAVYSSFRAVIGVADHMGRLKHFLSAMAVFRFLRWVARRFLYLLGISKVKPEVIESLWSSLSGAPGSTSDDRENWESELEANAKGSSWPIFMFLSFILAGPYLMWKLMSSLNLRANPKVNKGWATGESDHFLAVAQYDFEGMADRELKFQAGQKIRLAPAASQPPNVKGWVLGSDGVKIGLVPTNYIKILGKKAGATPSNDNPTTSSSSTIIANDDDSISFNSTFPPVTSNPISFSSSSNTNDLSNLGPRSFPLPPNLSSHNKNSASSSSSSSAFNTQSPQQIDQASPVLVSNKIPEETCPTNTNQDYNDVVEETPNIVVTPPSENNETSSTSNE